MTNGGNYCRNDQPGRSGYVVVHRQRGRQHCAAAGHGRFLRQPQLYGPNGALLENRRGTARMPSWTTPPPTAAPSRRWSAAITSGGTGTYVLHLAQFPEAFIVPAGDEGGPMTNGGNYAGTISLGDLDMWSFTANAGDNIVLRLGAVGFDGNLNLYGPNGALLKTAADGYGCRAGLHRHQQRHLHGAGERLLLRAASAPTCCIWPSFPRRSLCRRVMKAGP